MKKYANVGKKLENYEVVGKIMKRNKKIPKYAKITQIIPRYDKRAKWYTGVLLFCTYPDTYFLNFYFLSPNMVLGACFPLLSE